MASEDRTRKMSFSSQATVVQRWFGGEQLDHSKGAVRMDFLKSGRAPLLLNHDARQQVGVISTANIGSDKMGHAAARFGRTAIASDALQNVDDQILCNTSVGYRVHEMQLTRTGDDGDDYLITDWEPDEVSLVAVPADQAVGVGRTAVPDPPPDPEPPPQAETQPELPTEARTSRASSVSEPIAAEAATPGVRVIMTEATAAAPADKGLTAVAAENERRQAILNISKANKIDSRVEARWIEDGTPLTKVASEILDVMEARGKAQPTVATDIGMSRSETKNYSLFAALRALRYGNSNSSYLQAAAFEMDCSRSLAKQLGRPETGSSLLVPGEVLKRSFPIDATRAMATQPGSKGGYAISVENMGFIEVLRNRSIALGMGARQLSGLHGNVTFARQTASPSVTWQAGDGTSVTAADQTLGQLSLTPKTCIAITDVSEQLLRQASPSAEAFVMADLAADVAIAGVDYSVVNGTGGAQPVGIINTVGIASGQDASTATYAKILAFPQVAGSANALLGNPGFITDTAGAAVLMQRQRFTSTDTPLWAGNLLDGTCVGFNARSTEQVASGGLIFGSWDTVVIGDWGVLELSTDNGGTRFNQAQVGVRALWMIDVMIRYPQAWVVGTNLS